MGSQVIVDPSKYKYDVFDTACIGGFIDHKAKNDDECRVFATSRSTCKAMVASIQFVFHGRCTSAVSYLGML